MTKAFRLTTLNDAIDIATTLTKSWFRGHSRAVGDLVPRIFRPENKNPVHLKFRPAFEMDTIELFKRHAALLTELRIPQVDDLLGWLCVMQHYRAPTRLLDWSENLLVALYFAVSADLDQDGEVWAMFPAPLNSSAGAGWGIPLPEARHLKYLLKEPYWDGKSDELAKSLGLTTSVNCPLAIEPPLIFPRMAVQASTFTIHPSTEESKSIPEALTDPKHLVRYHIPAGTKQGLLERLRVLGVSDRHLFPDLEGLSRTIVFDNRVIAYAPPDPPTCSGEIAGNL
jgi:hypothetical protein